jgi:hypothetical protein
MITPTVAKQVRQFNAADRAAHLAVDRYVTDYMANRGLIAHFPRLVVGMMRELPGWPVRNADGGANVAYFTTHDTARTSIVAHEQARR